MWCTLRSLRYLKEWLMENAELIPHAYDKNYCTSCINYIK